MNCPYCGVALVMPDQPGPITSCDCGWYRMGVVQDPPSRVGSDLGEKPKVITGDAFSEEDADTFARLLGTDGA